MGSKAGVDEVKGLRLVKDVQLQLGEAVCKQRGVACGDCQLRVAWACVEEGRKQLRAIGIVHHQQRALLPLAQLAVDQPHQLPLVRGRVSTCSLAHSRQVYAHRRCEVLERRQKNVGVFTRQPPHQ